MNILSITASPNLGLYRLSRLLKGRGYNVDLLQRGEDYQNAWGLDLSPFRQVFHFPETLYFPHWPYVKLKNGQSLIRDIVNKQKIDLLYVVNIYSDYLSFLATSLNTVPVIHNVVDLHTLVPTDLTSKNPLKDLWRVFLAWNIANLERAAFKLSSGYVISTDAMRKAAWSKYRFDMNKSIILPNYVSRDAIITRGQRKLSCHDGQVHLVYEGVIGQTSWGYILPTILEIIPKEIHIHLYCEEKPPIFLKRIGANPFVHWEDYVKQKELTYEISKYDYGLIAYGDSGCERHLDTVLPNKLFDYLAAGLPVLSLPFKSIKEFVESNEVGITFNSGDELMKCLKTVDYAKLIQRVITLREQLTVEDELEKVVEFFERIAAKSATSAKTPAL